MPSNRLFLPLIKRQKGLHNIRVQLDLETGDFHVFTYKMAVLEVEDENSEINLAEAKAIDPRYEEGDMVEFEIFPKSLGVLPHKQQSK